MFCIKVTLSLQGSISMLCKSLIILSKILFKYRTIHTVSLFLHFVELVLTTGDPVCLILTKVGVTGQQRMLTPPWHLAPRP
jgi:hypothetical protein